MNQNKQIPPEMLKELNKIDVGLFIAMVGNVSSSVNSLNNTIKELDRKNSRLSIAIFLLSALQMVTVIDILLKWFWK
jgi:hypothetical protein